MSHKTKPAVVLGQHVMVGPSGTVAGRTGAITSAADSLQIQLFERGAHGSMPQATMSNSVLLFDTAGLAFREGGRTPVP